MTGQMHDGFIYQREYYNIDMYAFPHNLKRPSPSKLSDRDMVFHGNTANALGYNLIYGIVDDMLNIVKYNLQSKPVKPINDELGTIHGYGFFGYTGPTEDFSEEEGLPKVNNVEITSIDRDSTMYVYNSDTKEHEEKPYVHTSYSYDDVNYQLDFTGSIRIMKDYDIKHYDHMGYNSSFGYATILELLFDKGKLVDIIDRSYESEVTIESINNPSETEMDIGKES
jgi:hypothetical protein